jgi:hypothetical protein
MELFCHEARRVLADGLGWYNAGMQYTLRNVPRDGDWALRQKARRDGQSLNEVAIEALSRGVAVEIGIMKNHDLDFALGTWVEDSEFDKALDGQRQINPDLWK